MTNLDELAKIAKLNVRRDADVKVVFDFYYSLPAAFLELLARLKEAEEVIEWYAENNYLNSDDDWESLGTTAEFIDCFSREEYKNYPGKRARAYLAKHKPQDKGDGE